ncbi:MAG: filamentous hemagglutinin N-terminal domain-containing protein, partial [Alphaproteobacteria bacterium]|nr:filamentous hemagglutinin N-terminal domain-containing protein [Alphaproteobacteria bacterium]
MTNLFIKKEEFRWSFQKKGKQVLNVCTRLLFMAGVVMLMTGMPTAAQANPTGGTVVGGAATITSTPAELQINQTSQNAVIDWSSFNIAKGETTHFYQPGTSAVALNRVVNSAEISTINGNLLANGHVLVINPNGVLIGPSGNVDTAGFIATSADIANDDFMNNAGAGTLGFNIAGGANASVINEGKITVEGEGLAALVAPTVRNDGIIQGTLSKIQLGAADTFGVDLYGDGLISLSVGNGGASRTLTAENTGSIIASGGTVLMTAAAANDVVNSVINDSGDIQAQSLVDHNGEIILTAPAANVTVSGTLDVSGATGGGDIKVGGDAQGGGTLAHASTVDIASGATLNASATDNGNGGNIVVWSDNGTAFHGAALATGGQNGGNGGSVETSSPVNLQVSGSSVDTLAPEGVAGDWLLDPNSVTIQPSGATGSDINVSDIDNAKSNVTIQADNKITFNADVNMGYAGVGLTAKAGTAGPDWNGLTAGTGEISLSGHYVRTYGGYVMFESGNTISVGNATIYTRGGGFSLIGGDINVNNTSIATSGGAATFTSTYKAASSNGGCGGGNDNDNDSDDNASDGQISLQKMTLNTSGGTAGGGITIVNDGFTWNGTPAQLANNFGNKNSFETSGNAGKVSITSHSIRESNNNCISAGGTNCVVNDPVPLTMLTFTADNKTKTYGQTFMFGANDYTLTGTLAQGDNA